MILQPDKCSYFEWIGPPTCARGREVARKVTEKFSKLEGKIKELEDEIKDYKTNERMTKEVEDNVTEKVSKLEAKIKELEDVAKEYKTKELEDKIKELKCKRKEKIVVQVLLGLCLLVVIIIVNNVSNVKLDISGNYLP